MDTQAINEALGTTAWDYALPQDWFDEVLDKTGKNPFGHIVWSYGVRKFLGGPEPIDNEGVEILKEFNA